MAHQQRFIEKGNGTSFSNCSQAASLQLNFNQLKIPDHTNWIGANNPIPSSVRELFQGLNVHQTNLWQ